MGTDKKKAAVTPTDEKDVLPNEDGTCPEGYHLNDDKTKCVKDAPTEQKDAQVLVPAQPRSGLALPHLASRIFGVPLAVTPHKLQTVLAVVGQRLKGGDIHIEPSAGPLIRSEAKPVANVAVISIVGTLVKRAMPGESTSDLTYGEIQADFMKALTDESVHAIVLDMDSPGGEVSGMLDLADTIFKARGSKPIIAVCNELAASAAYCIASAADKIVIPRTGCVGSIGVIACHLDVSENDAMNGLKYTTVHAGDRKNDFDPHAPMSKEAQQILKAEVDRIYGLFVETVARNRGVSADSIRKTEAAVYSGEEALKYRLADEIGTIDSTIAGLYTDRQANLKAAEIKQLETKHAAELEESTMKAFQHGQKLSLEITRLCQLAKLPHLSSTFIERGLNAEQVGKELLAIHARKDGEEVITSHITPKSAVVKPNASNDKKPDVYGVYDRIRVPHKHAGRA